MSAYVQHNSQRRAVVFAVIIAFHALLVYGLVSGLARKVVEVIAPPIETDIIEEVRNDEPPPPPPPPQMDRPPVEVPPPEVTIDIPMETTQTTAITNVTDRPQPPAPPPPPAPKGPTYPAKIDARRFPNSEDYYPASAKRLGQEGSPVVRVCVGPNGKLVGEPTIQTSSNVEALDQGAIKLAKAGRYIAGMSDGQPVESCFTFRVKFELKN
jgi:protein TonB